MLNLQFNMDFVLPRLHLAAGNGRIEDIEKFLFEKDDINHRGPNGK